MELLYDYYCSDCGAPNFSGNEKDVDAQDFIYAHLSKNKNHRIEVTISRGEI